MSVLLARGQLADGTRLFSDATYAQHHVNRDATVGAADAPGALRPAARTSPATRSASTSSTTRAARSSCTPAVCPATCRRSSGCPSAQLGVTVLTNQESCGAFDSIVYRVARSLPRRAAHSTGPRRSASCMRRRLRRLPPSNRRPQERARTDSRAVASARQLRRHVHRFLVRRHCHRERERQARDALHEDAGARRRSRALAVRHLHRALARSRAARRCLRHASRSIPTAASIRRRCAPCPRQPTSASTFRTCS